MAHRIVAYLVAVLSLSVAASGALGAAGDEAYRATGPASSNAARNSGAGLVGILGRGASIDGDEAISMQPGHGQKQEPSLRGIPTISDTFKPRDQGTEWPFDAFTRMVVGHQSPEAISTPALHSYAGDGNMEALSVFPPFSRQEDRYDLGAYTGAVGPAGGSTPEAHPEITAP